MRQKIERLRIIWTGLLIWLSVGKYLGGRAAAKDFNVMSFRTV